MTKKWKYKKKSSIFQVRDWKSIVLFDQVKDKSDFRYYYNVIEILLIVLSYFGGL